MVDTSNINLLTLIGSDTRLKKAASTGGGEYHGACPFCGGNDRFIVQPYYKPRGRWSCRQCSPNWKDAIEYTKQRNQMGFKEAAEYLGLTLPDRPMHHHVDTFRPAAPAMQTRPTMPDDYIALNDRKWQSGASDFVWSSFELLWEPEGAKALDYLRERGLSDRIIEDAYLGYNPEDVRMAWGETEVWLPRGIVIPWKYKHEFWRINIRRPSGDPKYIGPKGNANGLYNAAEITNGCTVVMVEGEFDSLVIRSHAGDLSKDGLVTVATGTTSGSRLLRWIALLCMAKNVLLAFDVDQNEAGDKAADYWLGVLGDNAARLTPTEHDVTDMWKAGHDIRGWILSKAPELIPAPAIVEPPAPIVVNTPRPQVTLGELDFEIFGKHKTLDSIFREHSRVMGRISA